MSLAHVSFEHHDGIPVASIAGEVDAANAKRVADEVLQPLSNRTAGLVIDLTPTRYLDSAGLNLIFELSELLQTRRQCLSLLIDEQAPLSRILELSGVRATVPVSPTLPDAIAVVTRSVSVEPPPG